MKDVNRPSEQNLQTFLPKFMSQRRKLASEHSLLEARAKEAMNMFQIHYLSLLW